MENELLLLGLLRRREMHGYRLFEFIDQNLAACTDLKKPTAYYILNKMAQEGWIDQELEQDGNRPPRRVYRLTDKGEARFQQLLYENLSTFLPVYFQGDIGIAFLEDLDSEQALGLLHQRRAEMVRALAAAQTAPLHPGSQQLVVEHQVFHLKAELSWLDRVLEQLRTTVG